MENYVISFEKSGICQSRLIVAESAEVAEAYFRSTEPEAKVYGVDVDRVGYARRGMPTVEVPFGWSMPYISDLDEKVTEYREIQSQIAELEAQAEAIKDHLKGVMVEQGTETLTGTDWKASWKNVVSQRFDSKAFKAEHKDLYAAFCKPTVSTRFVLA